METPINSGLLTTNHTELDMAEYYHKVYFCSSVKFQFCLVYTPLNCQKHKKSFKEYPPCKTMVVCRWNENYCRCGQTDRRD